MPIFEYECSRCEKSFEKLVFNRNAPVECPDCGGDDVHKLLSVFGFVGQGIKSSSSKDSCGSCAASSCQGCDCH